MCVEIINQLCVLQSKQGQLLILVLDDYYHPEFHFCQPEGGPKKQGESLGSILFGDRIFNSPFDNV